MSTQVYDVPGISCEHCRAAIEQSVADVPGVRLVTVDVAARTATVDGDVAVDPVTAAIEQAGYEVTAVTEQSAAD